MPETNAETPAPQYRIFAPFTDDELEALNTAHGDIRVVRGATPEPKRWRPAERPEPPWEVVYRSPNSGESGFFERALHKDSKDMAMRNHAKATVVGVSIDGKKTLALDGNPMNVKATRAAFDALREKHGLAHVAASDALMSLAGMVAEEEGKE